MTIPAPDDLVPLDEALDIMTLAVARSKIPDVEISPETADKLLEFIKATRIYEAEKRAYEEANPQINRE